MQHAPQDNQPQQHPAKTCISRVTIAQEIIMILPSAPYARIVQIFIPEAASVFIDEDRPTEPNEDDSSPPGRVGRNRTYMMPLFDSDQNVEFDLAPDQWLVGMVADGMAHLTLIVTPKSSG